MNMSKDWYNWLFTEHGIRETPRLLWLRAIRKGLAKRPPPQPIDDSPDVCDDNQSGDTTAKSVIGSTGEVGA